jgi:hypothetical protein
MLVLLIKLFLFLLSFEILKMQLAPRKSLFLDGIIMTIKHRYNALLPGSWNEGLLGVQCIRNEIFIFEQIYTKAIPNRNLHSLDQCLTVDACIDTLNLYGGDYLSPLYTFINRGGSGNEEIYSIMDASEDLAFKYIRGLSPLRNGVK